MGKPRTPSTSSNKLPSFLPEMVLPFGSQHCSINSSKANVFTKWEEGNLDNILQGDCWFHCLIIQFQHEAQQFLQRITQFSLHLAVDSPVQGFIDHHSQVLQQLQTETKEAVQHKVLWRTSKLSLPSHIRTPHYPSGLSASPRMWGAQKAASCSSRSLRYSLSFEMALSSTSKLPVIKTKRLRTIP